MTAGSSRLGYRLHLSPHRSLALAGGTITRKLVKESGGKEKRDYSSLIKPSLLHANRLHFTFNVARLLVALPLWLIRS